MEISFDAKIQTSKLISARVVGCRNEVVAVQAAITPYAIHVKRMNIQ